VSVIRWEEPPAAGSGNPGLRKPVLAQELIAVQVRRRPGDWALIHEQSSNPAIISEINCGKLRPYRHAGGYEMRAPQGRRRLPDLRPIRRRQRTRR
jgi:hypothetical protein